MDQTDGGGKGVAEDSRGEAELLGIVLLLGFVVVGSASVFVIGGSAVTQLQGSSQDEAASESLKNAKADLNSIKYEGTRSISFGASTKEHTQVDPSAGKLTIKTPDGAEYEATFGSIIYDRGDRHIAYQGGGVWELHANSSTVVSRPNFKVYEGADGTASISFQATSLQGETFSRSDLTAQSRGANGSVDKVPQKLPEGQTTIEIESKYYKAWGEVLGEHAQIEYEHGKNTVVAKLNVPNEVSVENALAIDGQMSLGGGIGVDSYDSRSEKREGTVGRGEYKEKSTGDLFVNGTYDGGGSATVNGDLYVNGDFTIDGGSQVDGDIYATGDVTVKNDISGTVVSGGDILVKNGGVTFTENSDVRADGDLIDTAGGTYAGSVHVGGDFTEKNGNSILESSGEITAGRTVTIDENNGGQISEGEDGPNTSEIDQISGMSRSVPDPVAEVNNSVEMYKDDNDNERLGSLGGNGADDVITAGNYYHDGDLSYSGNPSLEFDTSGGDINLVVDGDVNAKNIDAEVTGDGRVSVYVTGNFETGGGAEWTNEDGAGDRLWVYTADSSDITDIAQEFYGVIISESEVELGGGTNVYGAIISSKGKIHGGQNIYYDEAIQNTDLSGTEDETSYQKPYFDVSVREISITKN